MVPLNYNQLFYFYKIAELGSISLASKTILISSPALSMQLKELEESLETQLFDRVGNKLVLTESGAIVYEYAKDIFKLGFELRDTISDRRREKERIKIDIGCQDTIPKNVADKLLTFLLKAKDCRVVLKEGNRHQLIEMQNDYKLDLILTNSVPSVNNSFIYESRLLLKGPLVILGHPKFKAHKGKVGCLTNCPLILPTFDSSLRLKLENFFLENNLKVDIIAEVEDKATEVDLALQGLGLIAVMKGSVPHLIQKKSLIEMFSIKSIQDEVWMIVGKRKILNPLALHAMKSFNL